MTLIISWLLLAQLHADGIWYVAVMPVWWAHLAFHARQKRGR